MLFQLDDLGVEIDLPSRGVSGRTDAVLFGESQGRIVLSVSSSDEQDLIDAAEDSEVDVLRLGTVNGSGRFKVTLGPDILLDAETKDLRETWENAIPLAMDRA